MLALKQKNKLLVSLVLLISCSLTLAACAAEPEAEAQAGQVADATSTPTTDSATDSAAEPTTVPEPESEAEAEAEYTADKEPVEEKQEEPAPKKQDPKSSVAECIVGTWELDNESFAKIMQEHGGLIDDLTGKAVVTFEKSGKMTTTYKNWSHRVNVDGQEMQVVREGTDTGTYKISSKGKLTIVDEKMGTTVKVDFGGGNVMTVPGEADTFLNTEFKCKAGTMTVKSDGATSLLKKVA